MQPPEQVPLWVGPAPEDGTPRVSGEFRGTRAPRTRRAKGTDSTLPPEEHPPGEPADVRLPAP